METMGMRLSVVKQSFFGPPGQYGLLVTRANGFGCWVCVRKVRKVPPYTTPRGTKHPSNEIFIRSGVHYSL